MASQRVEAGSRELSDEATEILRESRRAGTRKAYHHPWQEWVSWCESRQEDPVQASVELMANFLTEKFQSGVEYRTVNVYRSAISAYHAQVGGQSVGQHHTITQLLKGMFNMRPPQPKYSDTWDVEAVLARFRAMPEDEHLGLRDLSLKLTMLLALATASRTSELHKLKVSNMTDNGEVVTFQIPELTKTRKVGQGPMVIRLTPGENDKLDVVACLRAYLGKTRQVRKPGLQGDQLLISFREPHGPLASSSVAHWIKTGLQEAEIDTQRYQAHSTRAADTSRAAFKGLT